MAAHWLVKQEPGAYPFSRLLEDGGTRWDGVRNFQARNNLAAMAAGDLVLYYHSGEERSVVGLARVARAAYPDPTTRDERWVAVDIAPVKPLALPVSLEVVRMDAALKDTALVKQSRLSVVPLTPAEFRRFLALAKTSA